MFDKNYLDHSFDHMIVLGKIQYDYFICNKCNVRIWFYNRYFMASMKGRIRPHAVLPYTELTLTCEEVIIKNIIE